MLKHKKVLFSLWRISMAAYLVLLGVRIFQHRSPLMKELLGTSGYGVAVNLAIGIAALLTVLCCIVQYQEKRR